MEYTKLDEIEYVINYFNDNGNINVPVKGLLDRLMNLPISVKTQQTFFDYVTNRGMSPLAEVTLNYGETKKYLCNSLDVHYLFEKVIDCKNYAVKITQHSITYVKGDYSSPLPSNFNNQFDELTGQIIIQNKYLRFVAFPNHYKQMFDFIAKGFANNLKSLQLFS